MSLGSRVPCPLFLPSSRSIVAFKEPSWALKGNSAQLGRLGQLATRAGARTSCPPLLGHHQHLQGVGVDLCPGGEGQVAGLVGLGWLPWQAQLGHRLSQGGRAARRLAWHRRTTRLQPAGTAGRLIRDEQTDKKVDQEIHFMNTMALEGWYFSHFSDDCSLGLLSLAIFTSNYLSVRISAFNP